MTEQDSNEMARLTIENASLREELAKVRETAKFLSEAWQKETATSEVRLTQLARLRSTIADLTKVIEDHAETHANLRQEVENLGTVIKQQAGDSIKHAKEYAIIQIQLAEADEAMKRNYWLYNSLTGGHYCVHCEAKAKYPIDIQHIPTCIVLKSIKRLKEGK